MPSTSSYPIYVWRRVQGEEVLLGHSCRSEPHAWMAAAPGVMRPDLAFGESAEAALGSLLASISSEEGRLPSLQIVRSRMGRNYVSRGSVSPVDDEQVRRMVEETLGAA